MKVLFIGGTGRLSKDCASLALKKGWEVFLLTRGSKERKCFVFEDYKMIYADIRNEDDSKKALENFRFDVIIDFLTYNKEQLSRTLRIIEGKYKQYIFISTATVYKKRKETEIISEENTPIGNDRWNYAYDKYLCEEYLRNFFLHIKESYFTIIRPYVTYGNTRVPYPIVPFDTTKEWSVIYRLKNNLPIIAFDDEEVRSTITHTQDFAVGVVGLFANSKAFNEAFHITSDENIRWSDTLKILKKITNSKSKILYVSQENLLTFLPEYKEVLLGDKGTTMLFDNSKIKRLVPEFKSNIKLYNGIEDMFEFYESHPSLQLIDYYWLGRLDSALKSNEINVKFNYRFSSRKDRLQYLIGRYKIIRLGYRIYKKIKG